MTTDSGMDVSPSWQELKNERDRLDSHNTRLIQAGNELHAQLEFWQGSEHYPPTQWAMDGWAFAVEEAPAESLARIKAQWQAEALDLLLDLDYMNRHGYKPWPQYISERAAVLRRQAKEAICDT